MATVHRIYKSMPALTSKLKMLELLERNFPVNKPFTLQQVYPLVEDDLRRSYPNNNSIQQTIRKNLQLLRDDGIIEFDNDNPGTYHWASSNLKDDNEVIVGTLYILKNLVGGGGYKIGVSRVIKNRLKQLEVGTKAEVIGLWESSNYTDLERMLHRRYVDVRIPQSEWFSLSKDQLHDAVEWLDENASQVERNLKPRFKLNLKDEKLLAYSVGGLALLMVLQFIWLSSQLSSL